MSVLELVEKPILEEIAASTGDGRDITKGWFSPDQLQPTQDRILTSGVDYSLVLDDWQVKTALQQRQLAFINQDWEIVPGGTRAVDRSAADFLEDMIDVLQWDDISAKMHSAVLYGYSVGECLWARDGRYITLPALRVRDRRRFAVDGEGRLRLRTLKQPNGEILPDRKFWFFRMGSDHDDAPYGMGLAHWCYWPVLFKKQNVKFWLIALEKFGSPTAVGYFPPGATELEKERLLAALRAIQLDAAVIFPESMKVAFMEAGGGSRSGHLDYSGLCQYMDEAIAKIVVGQVMTSEATAGQYKAEVQESVLLRIAASDADMLCASFNAGPVKWLTEWNFPTATPPRIWRRKEEEEDMNQRAERELKVVQMGYRPTLKHIRDTYGGEWEAITAEAQAETPSSDEDEEEVEETPTSADEEGQGEQSQEETFADSTGTDPTREIKEQLADQSIPLVQSMMDVVKRVLDESSSLDEFAQRLLDLYADLPTEELAVLMVQAMQIADLQGRFDVMSGM